MRERSTLVSSLLLLGVLASGSYWLAMRARLFDATAKKPAHEVDYYAQHFELIRMDDDGHAQYHLGSERMQHYADDDSTALTQPSLTTLSPDKPVVDVTAAVGEVSSGGDVVHLSGGVRLVRHPSGDDPGLIATASRMTVWPDDDIAKTDVPVHAVHGRSTMDGQSMFFSNTDHVLKLNDALADARAYLSIEPRVKPASPSVPSK